MSEKTASQEIDDIIKQYGGWKGETIKRLRAVIIATDLNVQEEIKWRMKTRPEGLPVWVKGGIVCFVETWKDNIKLLFPKGAKLTDSGNLFNARLESASVRAIEIREGDILDEANIKTLVFEAIKLNAQ